MRFDPINITLDRSTNVYIQSKKALGLSSSDHTDWINSNHPVPSALPSLKDPDFIQFYVTSFNFPRDVHVMSCFYATNSFVIPNWIVVTSTH